MSNVSVGFIGIGRMGGKMAHHFLKAGYQVTLYDVDRTKCEQLVQDGALQADSPGGVAGQSEYIFLSLLNIEILENVLFGADGIAGTDLTGKVVIDTSTSIPSVSKTFADRIKDLGGSMLDAPVTGGEAGAEKGTLSFMVGGDGVTFERCLPLLKLLGTNIVHIGPSGHGQIAKAVNQMIMVGYFGVIAESFGFADQLGADITRVFRAIENGGPKSSILSGFGRTFCSDQPLNNGPKDTHYVPVFKKDVSYALAEGLKHNSYLPVSSTTLEMLKQVLNTGAGDNGPIRMFEFWRDFLNNKEYKEVL